MQTHALVCFKHVQVCFKQSQTCYSMFQTWNIPQVLWFPVHLSFGLLLLKDLQQHLIWVFVEHFQLCTAINLSTWHPPQRVLQTASSSPKHASSMPEHTFCKIFSLNRSITLEFQKLVMQSLNIGCFDFGTLESRLQIRFDSELKQENWQIKPES